MSLHCDSIKPPWLGRAAPPGYGPAMPGKRTAPRARTAGATEKTMMLRIRLTVAQRDVFEKAARHDGLDLSAFMRRCAFVRAKELGVDVSALVGD